MAQNTTIPVIKDDWVMLTNGDVTEVTFQNIGGSFVLLKATSGTTKPTSTGGAFRYNPGQGERKGVLADIFPGVSGANRVWAWAPAASQVVISHA